VRWKSPQSLKTENIGVAVLHCPTIKPLDEVTILAEVLRKPRRLVVVAENHSVVGGLGEAVASSLLQNGVAPARFRLAGLPDAFLDAGALPTLHDRYGISARRPCLGVSRAGSPEPAAGPAGRREVLNA
jgi:transketolase